MVCSKEFESAERVTPQGCSTTSSSSGILSWHQMPFPVVSLLIVRKLLEMFSLHSLNSKTSNSDSVTPNSSSKVSFMMVSKINHNLAGVIGELEDMRDEKISSILTNIQCFMRYKLAALKFNEMTRRRNAIDAIQSNLRAFMYLKDWEWMKIMAPLRWVTSRESSYFTLNKSEFYSLEILSIERYNSYHQNSKVLFRSQRRNAKTSC